MTDMPEAQELLVISAIFIDMSVENGHAGGFNVHTAGQTFNQSVNP